MNNKALIVRALLFVAIDVGLLERSDNTLRSSLLPHKGIPAFYGLKPMKDRIRRRLTSLAKLSPNGTAVVKVGHRQTPYKCQSTLRGGFGDLIVVCKVIVLTKQWSFQIMRVAFDV
jgi:hypothetical protein